MDITTVTYHGATFEIKGSKKEGGYSVVLEDVILDQLLPCPFCGSEAELQNTHTASCWAQCMNDDCEGQAHGKYFSPDKTVKQAESSMKKAIDSAIETWNRRE